MAAVGTLQEESQKRRERLKELRRKHENRDNDGPASKILASEEEEAINTQKPVFRSYRPQDETLKESVMPQIKPSDVSGKLEEHIALGKEESSIDEIEMSNLAPRKVDWDLKRDISAKLDKLERRTQRAIAELIRENLRSGDKDLVTTVNATAEAELSSQVDEDE